MRCPPPCTCVTKMARAQLANHGACMGETRRAVQAHFAHLATHFWLLCSEEERQKRIEQEGFDRFAPPSEGNQRCVWSEGMVHVLAEGAVGNVRCCRAWRKPGPCLADVRCSCTALGRAACATCAHPPSRSHSRLSTRCPMPCQAAAKGLCEAERVRILAGGSGGTDVRPA